MATPISYGSGIAQSILSPNSVTNNQQGQIIITTAAPIPTLVSTTVVSTLSIFSTNFRFTKI